MRLIDADAAIESLTEYGNGRAVYIGVEEAVRRIEQLPSAQPEQRWIPVTERLPEENLPVLVAVKQEDRLPKWAKERTHSYVTDIDVYDDGDFDTHKNKVVAWTALPEPYQGEQ